MYTFQSERNSEKLETYEWDNVWWEQAPDNEKKRVLYIGDSISCGIRHIATELSNGEILFDGFGTSKALDNPYFQESLHLFAAQERYRDLVLFNNGLHGWHLSAAEFEKYYADMLSFLKNEFSDTPIVIALSTSLVDDEKDKRVIEYNAVAERLAKENGFPIIDLYSATSSKNEMHISDGVHLTEDGYRTLAGIIVENVKEIMLA